MNDMFASLALLLAAVIFLKGSRPRLLKEETRALEKTLNDVLGDANKPIEKLHDFLLQRLRRASLTEFEKAVIHSWRREDPAHIKSGIGPRIHGLVERIEYAQYRLLDVSNSAYKYVGQTTEQEEAVAEVNWWQQMKSESFILTRFSNSPKV